MKEFPMLQLEMAKLDGYVNLRSHSNGVDLVGDRDATSPRRPVSLWSEIVPDYSQDLNAVHRVVTALPLDHLHRANICLIERMGTHRYVIDASAEDIMTAILLAKSAF